MLYPPFNYALSIEVSLGISLGISEQTKQKRKDLVTLNPCVEWSIGGAEEDRTPDLLTASQALSQLSYGPTGD